MAKAKSKKKVVNKADAERRGLLDLSKKETMLAVFIRNVAAHEAVRELLTAAHVERMSVGHAMVWKVVQEFYGKFDKLPDKNLVIEELHNVLNGQPDLLQHEELGEVDEFVEFVFNDTQHGKNIAKSELHVTVALDTCRQFLEEVEAATAQARILNNNTVPIDLPELLRQSADTIALAQSITSPPLDVLFPVGWDTEKKVKLYKTDIPSIDNFTGGGIAGSEVVVIMGPFGSCKTTIAVQLAVNMAEYACSLHTTGEAPAGKRPVAVLISTEMGDAECRIRSLSYAASIPRDRLEKMTSLNALCKDDEPAQRPETQYEKKYAKPKDETSPFANEFDRASASQSMLNQYLLFVNCTAGNRHRKNAGAGGLPEVAAVIASEMRRRPDIYPIFFCLDHASALATRMIEASATLTHDDLRHVLKAIPLRMGEMFGKPYDAPCVIMHQLSGEANSYGPAAKLDHTNASECRSFAEYADFAAVIGKPTEDEDQVAAIKATKHRRQPPKGVQFVGIDGAFCRVVDRTEEFTTDPSGKTIINKKTLAMGQQSKAIKGHLKGKVVATLDDDAVEVSADYYDEVNDEDAVDDDAIPGVDG